MQDTWVQSLGREDPLEEGMVTHSSILASKIMWTEEPRGLQSRGSQKSWRWLSTHIYTPEATTKQENICHTWKWSDTFKIKSVLTNLEKKIVNKQKIEIWIFKMQIVKRYIKRSSSKFYLIFFTLKTCIVTHEIGKNLQNIHIHISEDTRKLRLLYIANRHVNWHYLPGWKFCNIYSKGKNSFNPKFYFYEFILSSQSETALIYNNENEKVI